MKKFVTEGEGLHKLSSPISHAVVVDNICYLSGQLSIDANGKFIDGTSNEQAERSFANLFCAVRAAGFSVDDLTFIDIAFINLEDLSEINKLYANLFPEGRRPARTIYQAAALPYGGRIKVMGVAIKETVGA
jgi:2-iminobutanoate/2-iminopropanoate deaminase